MSHLFHATWPSRQAAIEREGIRPGGDGAIYLANKPHYAAGFMRLRGHEVVGWKEIDIPGLGKRPVPDIVQHETIIIAKVDTSMLDQRLLSESDDHVMGSGMYPDDLLSWRYQGTIPPEAIVDWLTQPTVVPSSA